STEGHPLRILVLGPARSGKTSLIEALSGGTAEACPADSDKGISAQLLTTIDWGEFELWDTPARESLPRHRARQAVAAADIIIWVSHMQEMDAPHEAEQLARLRRWLGQRVGQPEPPLLVALTHCEGLDSAQLESGVARSLSVSAENIIWLSLSDPLAGAARERLHAAFTSHHAQALRSQYWRYLHRQRRAENRRLAGRQLRNVAGN